MKSQHKKNKKGTSETAKETFSPSGNENIINQQQLPVNDMSNTEINENCSVNDENPVEIKLDEATKRDLDSFNALNQKMFIAKYASLEDSTASIITLVKNIPSNKADKLIRYILKLTNFDIFEIEKLTLEKSRSFRQISTRIIYAYIISKYKEGITNNINILFKNTFLRRYKDVDPVIRAYSYEFLINFISLDQKLFNKHKGMLLYAIKDKQDIVRKSIISTMRSKNIFIKNLPLIELAKGDKNKNIRLEICKFILEQFLNDNYDEDTICDILKFNGGSEKFTNKEFQQLLCRSFKKMSQSDAIGAIHKFYTNCKDYLESLEIEYFECDCTKNCYLQILELQKKSLKISELFEFYKNNLNDLDSIIGLLNFSDIDNTEIFIKFIDEIIKNIRHNNDMKQFDKLCEFFKKCECDYKSIIENAINTVINIRDFRNVIIKYFDIEDFVRETDYLETQIYKNLWDIVNEEYTKLTKLTERQYDIFCAKDLCNLILYIHSQIKDSAINIDDLSSVCCDKKTALRVLYCDLIKIIDLDNSELLPFLYKFNEEGILEEQMYLIYKHIKDVKEFSDIFSVSKNKINYVVSFFKFLNVFDGKDFVDILSIAKIINLKFKDNEKRVIFKNIKNFIESSTNYICLNIFINKLNINECIVLESICKDSKFKDLLNKRINKTKGLYTTSETKVTYL